MIRVVPLIRVVSCVVDETETVTNEVTYIDVYVRYGMRELSKADRRRRFLCQTRTLSLSHEAHACDRADADANGSETQPA